jgi:hypothetical protein
MGARSGHTRLWGFYFPRFCFVQNSNRLGMLFGRFDLRRCAAGSSFVGDDPCRRLASCPESYAGIFSLVQPYNMAWRTPI